MLVAKSKNNHDNRLGAFMLVQATKNKKNTKFNQV